MIWLFPMQKIESVFFLSCAAVVIQAPRETRLKGIFHWHFFQLPAWLSITALLLIYNWIKVFKNGPSKICGRQSKQTISLQFFKGCVPQILLAPFLNTLTQLLIFFREYTIQDQKIIFQVHVRLNGDIILLVHHGRSTLGGKVQGKLTSINIFALQFHTGFLEKENNQLMFSL